jgi:protein TonB
MPKFPGGDVKLMEFNAKNTKYPAEAVERDLKGKILVTFIVEKDGSISNVKAVDGGEKVLSDEAVRVVKTMPRWTPGKLQGEVVRCRFTIPVIFNLN